MNKTYMYLKKEKCKLKFVFYVGNVGRKVYVSCDSNLDIRQTYKHSCYNYTRPTYLVRAKESLLSLKSRYLYVHVTVGKHFPSITLLPYISSVY